MEFYNGFPGGITNPDMVLVGHGGQDYASGCPICGFNVKHQFGVSVIMNSLTGMNCSATSMQSFAGQYQAQGLVGCKVYNALVGAMSGGSFTPMDCGPHSEEVAAVRLAAARGRSVRSRALRRRQRALQVEAAERFFLRDREERKEEETEETSRHGLYATAAAVVAHGGDGSTLPAAAAAAAAAEAVEVEVVGDPGTCKGNPVTVIVFIPDGACRVTSGSTQMVYKMSLLAGSKAANLTLFNPADTKCTGSPPPTQPSAPVLPFDACTRTVSPLNNQAYDVLFHYNATAHYVAEVVWQESTVKHCQWAASAPVDPPAPAAKDLLKQMYASADCDPDTVITDPAKTGGTAGQPSAWTTQTVGACKPFSVPNTYYTVECSGSRLTSKLACPAGCTGTCGATLNTTLGACLPVSANSSVRFVLVGPDATC